MTFTQHIYLAILRVVPLDVYVENPVTLMAVLPDDSFHPEIVDVYRHIGRKYEETGLRETTV